MSRNREYLNLHHFHISVSNISFNTFENIFHKLHEWNVDEFRQKTSKADIAKFISTFN